MKEVKLILALFFFTTFFVHLIPFQRVYADGPTNVVQCSLYINPKTDKWAQKVDGKYVDETVQDPRKNDLVAQCTVGEKDFEGKLSMLTWILVIFSSLSALISIIHAGVKYINSAGNTYAVEEAKKQMWYTAIGWFVVLSAISIVNLISMAISH